MLSGCFSKEVNCYFVFELYERVLQLKLVVVDVIVCLSCKRKIEKVFLSVYDYSKLFY